MKPIARLGVASLALSLAACSTVDSVMEKTKIDYKSASKAPTSSLEVPPDLSQINRDPRYVVPASGTATASGFQVGQQSAAASAATAGAATATRALGDVRIERDGNQRWLVVSRPADQLWNPVRDFWQDSGFLLTIDQAQLGIMETDWAENRAKIPQDFIRSTVGKVFEGLYSSSERDKFRTRLERRPDGGTDIFISHRGMVEKGQRMSGSGNSIDSTVWEPRPVDPELETEFLRRLMVKLGVSEEQSKAVAATAGRPASTAQLTTLNNAPALTLNEDFDRAWRRVGLSLDRTGFTVEDRDRSKGLYYVRYVAPNADKKEPGFFGKLFSSNPSTPPLQYRISVAGQGSSSVVVVQNSNGSTDASANAQSILRVLSDDLR